MKLIMEMEQTKKWVMKMMKIIMRLKRGWVERKVKTTKQMINTVRMTNKKTYKGDEEVKCTKTVEVEVEKGNEIGEDRGNEKNEEANDVKKGNEKGKKKELRRTKGKMRLEKEKMRLEKEMKGLKITQVMI